MTTRQALRIPDRISDGLMAARNRVVPWLLSVVLAVLPASWLPGVPDRLLRMLEWAAVVVAVGVVLASEVAAGRRPFPRGLLGPWGFAGLVGCWIPGLVRAASSADRFDFFVDVATNSAFLWCFFCLARSSNVVWAVLGRGLVIFVVGASLALLNEIPALSLWSPPQDRAQFGGFTGFSDYSTGWSITLAMFLPLTALAVVPRNRRPYWGYALAVIGSCTILASQFLSSGRAGLLATVMTLAGMAVMPFSRRLLIVLLMIAFTVGVRVCSDISCAEHLRIEELAGAEHPVELVCNVDRTSTRRVKHSILGLTELAESPLVGHGLGQFTLVNHLGTDPAIHNMWLNWAVYTGLLAPLWLMAMVGVVLRTAKRVCTDRQSPCPQRCRAAVLALIWVAGLAVSLMEPRLPFGSFHIAAIWWAAAGTLLGLAARGSGIGSGMQRQGSA